MPSVQSAIQGVQARVQAIRAQLPRGPIRNAIGMGAPATSGQGMKDIGFEPNTYGVGVEMSSGLQSVIGAYPNFRGVMAPNLGRVATYRGQSVNLGGYRESSPVQTSKLGNYRLTT